jgi:excisionase family DNA binding protein
MPSRAKLPMNDPFLTTEDVTDYLQLNLRTVYRLIRDGRIPAVRVGRQWRFRRSDVDRWLEGRKPATPGTRDETVPRVEESVARSGRYPSGRRCILVVDAEATARDSLSKALSLAEYDVVAASDGRTALSHLETGHYDVLITELKLLDMDGLALVREARMLAPGLPAVVVTGSSTEASAIDAINLGVSGYMTKPFPISGVCSAIEKALRA